MRTLFAFAALALAAPVFGQTQGTVACSYTFEQLQSQRGEGYYELANDIVLSCTGGTTTPQGQAVPTATITVTIGAPLTSRTYLNGASEALLLIDEPQPANQVACLSTFGGPVLASSKQPCTITKPAPSASCGTYTCGQPNVFQGQAGTLPDTVAFPAVPFDPPGPGATRTLRFTNIRINANQPLVSQGSAYSGFGVSITASVAILSGSFKVTFNKPSNGVVNILPSLSIGITAGTFEVCASTNNGQPFASTSGNVNPAIFNVLFSEAAPFAFKPAGGTVQNVPGTAYNTESGFVPDPSLGLPSGLGMANTGTRLVAKITGLPQGSNLTVPATIPLKDSSGNMVGQINTQGTAASSGIVLTPDATGTVVVNFVVTEHTASTGAAQLSSASVPFTLGGTFTVISAAMIVVNAGYDNAAYPTVNFAAGSGNAPPIPVFGPLDAGVSLPAPTPISGRLAATVVPCPKSGETLAAVDLLTGLPLPASGLNFIGVSGGPALQANVSPDLLAPSVWNFGLLSQEFSATGLQVTQNPATTWLNAGAFFNSTPTTATLSVNDAPGGRYSTNLNIGATGVQSPVSVPVTLLMQPGPWFMRFGFQNQASYANGVVAPGEPFTIVGGDGFGPASIALPQLGANGRAVTTLGNTQVFFDGVAAPLYYSLNNSGLGQVAGFAPFELVPGTQTNVAMEYNGVNSPPIVLNVIDVVPGLYTANASGVGQGAILNQNQTINGINNPASPGDIITLFGACTGQTSPPGRDGALAGVGGPLAVMTLPVQVFIDGIQATNVPYAGPAPGIVEGVFQIDVQIPSGVTRNASVPVVVQIEDKLTQPGVTLTVK